MFNKYGLGVCVIRCVDICVYKFQIVNLNLEDQYFIVFILDLLFNFNVKFGIKQNGNIFIVFVVMVKINFIILFIVLYFF